MANDFFDTGDYTALVAHTLARGSAVNAIFQAIEVGFNRLPTMLQLNEDRVTYAVEQGGSAANVYVFNLPKTLAAYTEGLRLMAKSAFANTGASTINIDGRGAKSMLRTDGTALQANDITANTLFQLGYDGTNFRVLTGAAGATDLLAHTSATAAHGATGAVVGTTNSQTLTNKTISGGILTGATTLPGSGQLSAAGLLGLGMTPTNILDITQTQDAASIGSLLNSHAGTSASASLRVTNGTSVGLLRQHGTGFTTAGVLRQNGTLLDASGAGGLTLNTSTNQPVYIGVNSTQIAKFSQYGLGIDAATDLIDFYILKARRDQNQGLLAELTNGSATAAAYAAWQIVAGGNSLSLRSNGDSFTTAGIARQSGAMVTTDKAGGLTIGTTANQPTYFAVNNAEVGRWTANTFNIGGTTDAVAFMMEAKRDRDGQVVIQAENAHAGTAAQVEVSVYNGTSFAGFLMNGTGFTTAGINRQNGAQLITNGAGGLTLATTANQPIYFAVNSTQVAAFNTTPALDLTCGQIKFPGTQVASGDANTLDDYEEGTFTVTAMGDGTNNYTLSLTDGNYTKIGNRVFWEAIPGWSSIGSAGAGQLRFGGLPFTSLTGNPTYPATIGNASGLDFTATLNPITAHVTANSTICVFYRQNDNAAPTALPANSSSASGQIQIGGHYRV
jgi:hypothetical protein